MKKLLLAVTRIALLLCLLFAGISFPVTAHWASTATPPVSRAGAPLGPFQLYLPLILKGYTEPAPLWRFGISRLNNPLTAYNSYGMASMRLGWYVNYSTTPDSPNPYGVEFLPTIRVKQWKVAQDGTTKVLCRVGNDYASPADYQVTPSLSAISTLAGQNPGQTWLIGNEVDRRDWGSGYCASQDEMLPEVYAQAYHDIYATIKAADPTAQVAIGAMVEFTPLRQQYLQKIWDAYQAQYGGTMPVDVWNIHLYVLREEQGSWGADIPPGFNQTQGTLYSELDNKDFSLAWDQIVALRTWMKAHGQQNKPLIISEYGVLFPPWVIDCPTYPLTTGCPFSPEQIRDSFMYPSFNAFLNQTDPSIGYPADGNRLVQRWNWFSLDYDDGNCEGDLGHEIFYDNYAGALFNSGLISPCSPDDPSRPIGLTALGTYWQQYVRSLPPGSARPYSP